MRYLLSRASLPILAQLAKEQTLCAFDFDGTLAPIVERPDQAKLSEHTREILARLAALYPCVILSGRRRADVIERLDGVPVERVFGSHGAEADGFETGKYPEVERWKTAIESELRGVPGVWVEDKGLSLAVHYRESTRRSRIRRQILNATQYLEHARVFGGKYVVNVVIEGSPDKGTALLAERERLHCSSVLYVGDDQNDEDAFAIGGSVISVRIGRARDSKARYYLRTQDEMDTLLHLMVTLREQSAVQQHPTH